MGRLLLNGFFGKQRVTVPAERRSLPERILDARLPKKLIVNCDRDAYLHRWYLIRTKLAGVFVHKFVRSDEDRALHDHPWNFIVIPIWRGYVEHSDKRSECWLCKGVGHLPESLFGPEYTCDECKGRGFLSKPLKRRVLPIFGIRFRRATYRHRVELLPCDDTRSIVESDCLTCNGSGEKPAWSIFIRFREWREWGFHLPEGWLQWAAFWREKCE